MSTMTRKRTPLAVPVRELERTPEVFGPDFEASRLLPAWIAECNACSWVFAGVCDVEVRCEASWHRNDHTRRAAA